MRYKVGSTYRVVLDEVKDATGYPIAKGVPFLWSTRSGASFTKGDEFTIIDVLKYGMWVTSSSPKVEGKEVFISKKNLREALKTGMVTG